MRRYGERLEEPVSECGASRSGRECVERIEAAEHAATDLAAVEVDVGERRPQAASRSAPSLGGDPVPGNTQGSVRPDWYAPGDAVEVKNYDVETSAGRARLGRKWGTNRRADGASARGPLSGWLSTIRGQELAIPERRVLAERIADGSGGAVGRPT